jgi:hypothetical protein
MGDRRAGFVMATALLTPKYFGMGDDLVAAGFLVFAIAEAVLLLISVPKKFALPLRLLGLASAPKREPAMASGA